MFNNEWLENTTDFCTLPEDDPEAFFILLNWVFDVPYKTPIMFTSQGCHIHLNTFMSLVEIADKYMIDDFADIIEERLVFKSEQRLIWPSDFVFKTSWFKLGWEILPLDSILREYFRSAYKGSRRPKVLRVTRKMLKEWEEILAGHKDIREDLKKLDPRGPWLNKEKHGMKPKRWLSMASMPFVPLWRWRIGGM